MLKMQLLKLQDTTVLNCMFSCLICPECLQCETIYLEDINAKKKGLSRYLCIKCNNCDFNCHFYSSKTVGDNKFDVNIRMVYRMIAIGRGYSPLKRLCGYLDLPEPMTVNNYDKLSKSIKAVTKNVAEWSMLDASKVLKGEMDTADAAVFVQMVCGKKEASPL